LEIIKEDGSSVLIRTEDRIDLSNSHLLKEKLQMLFEEGYKNITLDFSLVTNIDNSGLGVLLLFQKKLKEYGGKLKIVNINGKYVREMFRKIHLYKVIQIEGEPWPEK
jgi:anti-sigma B factor antagonist